MPKVTIKKLISAVWLALLIVVLSLYIYTNTRRIELTSVQLDSAAVKTSFSLNNNSVKTDRTPVLALTTKSQSQSKCRPQQSFVFIKTHKSGSTTMIAPLQKYAYLHNLTMVVPALNNNIHLSWPRKFVPNESHMTLSDGGKFKALVNHIVYNKESIRSIMDPSATYLTIVRDPAPHLISSVQYFSVDKANNFLRLSIQQFEAFLSDPVKHDPKPVWMQKQVNPEIKSLTRNLQSADLGLPYDMFDNRTAIDKFINEIKKDFSILIVLERLSESLVLMKRKLCWSMQDIIHVNKNIQKTMWQWSYKNISQSLLSSMYQWNNADTLLYKLAGEKLNALREGEMYLEEEIKLYNNINSRVSQYCGGNINSWKTDFVRKPLVIEKSPYNEAFEVDGKFCVLLLLKEEEMTLLFKCKQHPLYQQCIDKASEISTFLKMLGEN